MALFLVEYLGRAVLIRELFRKVHRVGSGKVVSAGLEIRSRAWFSISAPFFSFPVRKWVTGGIAETRDEFPDERPLRMQRLD